MAVALVLAGTSACSKGSSGVSSADAANEVAQELLLSPEQQSCLEDHFSDDEPARAALDPADPPTADELRALEQVTLACVDTETMATTIGRAMAAGYGAVSPEQRQCIENGVRGLSRDQQAAFVSGPLALSTSQFEGGPGEALTTITGQLVAQCGLQGAQPGGTAGAGLPEAPVDETTRP